ncbi:uncharacterized protein SCHCODRAFT_01319709 [Schizophyllum commune H4-8]|uniref:uncharacterized protein n=1 Tax=Schizophyllum commune (strain H4-8 / FGSC 9210) TaxID=578458 RepID=UPI00215EE69A|nr:uncharacterized protein SCHCODRAFT_01319709 [Schizophyllum commune H4-8]KAI5890637.1 hypothetical protein SCHCODRAFT_01319709 [Schizophyllum commune H4-8]
MMTAKTEPPSVCALSHQAPACALKRTTRYYLRIYVGNRLLALKYKAPYWSLPLVCRTWREAAPHMPSVWSQSSSTQLPVSRTRTSPSLRLASYVLSEARSLLQ